VFATTLFLVCFPYPNRFITHVQRWQNPNELIDPGAIELKPMIDELAPQMAAASDPSDALGIVEKFVYEHVKYEWDWNNWGNADYIPSVAEVVSRGQEDCDGRAVIAASLLEHFGIKSQIVTDFAHVWVKTQYGETMGPGTHAAIEASDQGLQLQAGALLEACKGLAFGVAAFPIGRELIILVMAWWLLLRWRGGIGCQLAALAFLLNGLVLLRLGGKSYQDPVRWLQISGLTNLTIGMATLLLKARSNARVDVRSFTTSGMAS